MTLPPANPTDAIGENRYGHNGYVQFLQLKNRWSPKQIGRGNPSLKIHRLLLFCYVRAKCRIFGMLETFLFGGFLWPKIRASSPIQSLPPPHQVFEISNQVWIYIYINAKDLRWGAKKLKKGQDGIQMRPGNGFFCKNLHRKFRDPRR